MSDPSAAAELEEAPPPPRPPRPRQQQQQQPRGFQGSDYSPAAVYQDQPQPKTSTPASQMEADELYARQLAEHYGAIPSDRSRQGRGGYGNYPEGRRRQAPQQTTEDEDREHSFFDDDLPVIRENLRKGFLETQTKVNKFIADLGKKISGEEDDQQAGGLSPRPAGGQRQPQQYQQQQYPQRYSSRRSGDAYDADPELIQGDFSHLELRDNTEEPRRTRPIANPDLFGSASPPQGTKSGLKTVSFANTSDDDLYRKPAGMPSGNTPGATTAPGGTATATGGNNTTTSSKWAPLSTVEPTPLTNDPFQLADSDDEHDTIQTTAAKTGPQESGTKPSTK
ncbi:ubiquitin-binding protein cue5, variant 2 [Orbilia brochopaga]|uniref:Ubiquitin-binding protein cue5, variant 2 n=1 Tax=Orbilia brochopaga TaxID=3140254 RepID=A0AAV9UFZ3_9PEZI